MLHPTRYLVYLPKSYNFFVNVVFLMTVALSASGCAAIQPLEGGPKDTVPPKVVKTYPAQESTHNFQGKKEKAIVQLTFDKEVEVQDIYNKLIVTPKLARREEGPSYVCKVKNNRVELRLAVPLEENTTYTFNFKDAIRDTHEGTPAENPTLTFSTGAQVDSLYITGQVKLLMTDQPAKALVALYRVTEEDNTHILNSAPDYFTESKEDGAFRLEHIKQGTYRLCAGQSKESKLTIDPSQEPYGFLATPLELNEPLGNIPVYIVQANTNEFKVQSSKPNGPYFEISCSKPVNNYSLALKHTPKRLQSAVLYSHLVDAGATIRVYNTLGLLEDDLLEAKLEAQDDMGNTIEEVIKLQFKGRKIEKEAFKYTIQPPAGAKMNANLFQVDIQFNKPVKDMQADKLYLLTAQKEKYPISPAEISLHPHRDKVTIQKKLSSATPLPSSIATGVPTPNEPPNNLTITLQIDKGAFVSIEKELNQPGTYPYVRKSSQECGSIKGSIRTKAAGFIVQLLDQAYEVVDEIHDQQYYDFTDVLPGNYWIRVLVTSTKGGKWRFGNIHQWIPPDPVIFYPDELAIVAHWELEDIDLEF